MMQCKRVLEEFQSKFLDVKNMVITCSVDLVRRLLVGQGCEGKSWWFDGRRRGHPSGSPTVESISLPLSLWVPSPNSRQAARLPRASPCPRPEQLPRH